MSKYTLYIHMEESAHEKEEANIRIKEASLMRRRYKKIVFSGVAVTAAGVIGAGAVMQTGITVQASAVMMPGIEKIVESSAGMEPFSILEITDSKEEAEIGYYVSGQEPYVKLYEYVEKKQDGSEKIIRFSSVEEGLSLLKTRKERTEFIMNVKLKDDGSIDPDQNTGIRQIKDLCVETGTFGDTVDAYPLSYSQYQEKYFLTAKENTSGEWKEVDLLDDQGSSRMDTVQINGRYQENAQHNGNYTRQEDVYYPIRFETNDKENGREQFRENINSFYYAEDETAGAPYQIVFAPVNNSDVNNSLDAENGEISDDSLIHQEYDYNNGRYGYYENVYKNLTDDLASGILEGRIVFPGEDTTIAQPDSAVLIRENGPLSTTEAFAAGEEESFSSVKGDDVPEEQEQITQPAEQTPQQEQIPQQEQTPQQEQIPQQESVSDSEFSAGDDSENVSSALTADFISEAGEMPGSAPVTQGDVVEDEMPSGLFSEQSDMTGVEQEFSPEQSVDIGNDIQGSANQQEINENMQQGEPAVQADDGQADVEEQTAKILGAINDTTTAGTSANPNVYLAEHIDSYPYYKYTLIGDLQYVKANAVPEANARDLDVYRENTEPLIIIKEEGDYVYRETDSAGKWIEKDACIVAGRQPVALKDIRPLPETLEYNYYYRVEKVYFCCKAADDAAALEGQYFGWYGSTRPTGEDPYIPIAETGEVPTHYIMDAAYKLTPGIGDHDFIPDDTEPECAVEVNHMYYKGGYVNHDWLKRYVFNLSPDDPETMDQFEKFEIQVDTILSSKISTAALADSKTVSDLTDGTALPGQTAAGEYDQSGDENAFGDGETEALETAAFTDEAQGMAADETFTSGSEDDTDAAALSVDTEFLPEGRTGQEVDKDKLTSYDLVYINGWVSEETINALITAQIPCIINQAKISEQNTTGALQDYIKQDDADKNYVSQFLYFFNGNSIGSGMTDGNAENSGIVNLAFHTAFIENQSIGFDEITAYIESENEYREVAQSGLSDGTKVFLKDTLSQARAVEYIINYKYKRSAAVKDTIQVLEIEPAKYNNAVGQISKDDVYKWVGVNKISKDNVIVKACSFEPQDKVDNLMDGNTGSLWHTKWNGDGDTKHWLTIELKSPSSLGGFVYTRRKDGDNGVFTSCDITLTYKENGEKKTTSFSCNNIKYDASNNWTYRFDKTYQNVEKIEFKNIVGKTSDTTRSYASCAELALYNYMPEVVITPMLSSEFAGKVEDLNAKYDIIYWGAKGKTKTTTTDPKIDTGDRISRLISGDGDLLYAHVGGHVKIGDGKMQGLLDSDYNSSGSVINNVNNLNWEAVGSVRGAGNDITQQQVDAVLEFARSGYPVIVADKLYTSSGGIVTRYVDNSSYVYTLLDELENLKSSYKNICTQSEADKGSMNFFVSLPKPMIEFIGIPGEKGKETGKPEDIIGNVDGPSPNYVETQQLYYHFSIHDEAQVSPAGASYDCKLFLDLNSDGNFSSTEELEDIQITDEYGNTLVQNAEGKYELKLDRPYTLTRPLPAGYYKLITWKLKVSENSRPQIWTTQQGYCKQKVENASNLPSVRVLQVYSLGNNDGGYGETGTTWHLKTDDEFQRLISNTVAQNDFSITIDEVDNKTFSQNYRDEYNNYHTNMLDKYDMLIFGFADMYNNIPDMKPNEYVNNVGETVTPLSSVSAILQFIKDGKSVLFAHDTTSHFGDKNANENTKEGWGKSFNRILRPLVGLDRYGMKDEEIGNIISKGFNSTQKKTQAGNKPDGWDILGMTLNEWNAILSRREQTSGGDLPYVAGSGRTSIYAQTQGFTSTVLYKDSLDYSNTVRQVNTGAITEYPFDIPDEMEDVAKTHGQYYQLALEEDSDKDGTNDIVVWYCLGGGKNYDGNKYTGMYDVSPNDVRNNYYLYSKGNIMYTGVGHSTVSDLDEKKLFLNAIVAAYRASAVDPKVQFVSEFSRTAKKIQADYYMTDQYIGSETQNVIDNTKEFYLTVDDYNLVASDSFANNARSMELELYIDDPENGTSGTVFDLNTTNKVSRLVIPLYGQDGQAFESGGVYQVSSGNVYRFTLQDIEQYVKNNTDHRYKEIKLYAKVSVSFTMYGKPVSGTGTSELSLKHRQLFDMN